MSATAVPFEAGLGRLLLAVHGEAVDDAHSPGRATGPSIAGLRRRDPDAWRDLFEQEMAAIYRYVSSRVGREDADDVTSQVFAAAWEHAESLEDRGLPARAWLFGIARYVAGSHRRRLLSRPPAFTLEGWDRPVEALDPALLDLAAAVQRLGRGHAEVVTLRFVHGLSLAETAEALAMSVDAVKGRQARALKELRDMLEPPAAEPVPAVDARRAQR